MTSQSHFPVNIPKQGLYRICIGKPLQPVQYLYGQALKHNRACTDALINPLRMHIGPVQDLLGQPKESCKIPVRVLYKIKSRFIQASLMNPVHNLYGSFIGLIQALYVAPTNPVYCYLQYLYPVNMPWCVRIHRESVQCYQHWASSRPVLAHGGMLTGYQCNDWPQMGLDQLSNWIQSTSGPLSHVSMDKCGAWVFFVIFYDVRAAGWLKFSVYWAEMGK